MVVAQTPVKANVQDAVVNVKPHVLASVAMDVGQIVEELVLVIVGMIVLQALLIIIIKKIARTQL